ncbi:protein kinase family protein [Kitasatospora sp. NPDC052896]|uniref:protein kinase family protein n=1 Tax=Kitasatospora sp. NPDC052896 TaxID=3364061 RepID=UPI0037C8132D
MPDPDPRYGARFATYRAVATRLALLSDRRLGEALAAAVPLGSGIGGRSAELEVGGTRVFVKRVPLTDLELRPEHLRSTANLFGLPLFYQYGVGSAGFGAWRELAAHTMTTDWVLGRESPNFPLMYHWRVLPDQPPEGFVDAFGSVARAVAYWDGSPAVRERLEAIGESTASLALFLEHVPQTLADWLHDQRDPSPYPWVAQALERGTAFMARRGFVHFDTHFRNVLTDGRLLYFADFGLALSSDFELSTAETEFLAQHRAYDRYHTASHLLRHHLLDGLRGGAEPTAFLRAWLDGRQPGGVPGELAAIIERHARATVILDGFRRRLIGESKRTPFPAAELERAARATASP